MTAALVPGLARVAPAGDPVRAPGTISHRFTDDWDHHPGIETHHGSTHHGHFGGHGFDHHWDDHHFGWFVGWGFPYYWPYDSTWYEPAWYPQSTTYVTQTYEVPAVDADAEAEAAVDEDRSEPPVDAPLPLPEQREPPAPGSRAVWLVPVVETLEAPESLPELAMPGSPATQPERP